MNILFLTCWYPTDQKPGFGIFVKEHATAIKLSGNNILVVHINVEASNKLYSLQTEEFIDENEVRTLRITICSFLWKIIYLVADYLSFLVYRLLRQKVLHEFIPDIVHSNVLYPAGIAGHRIAKRLKKPHFITEHWSDLDKFFSTNFYAREGKRAYRDAKMILPVSSFLESNIRAYIGDTGKFAVVPNVISPRDFTFHPKDNLKQGIFRFVAVANWTETKDQIKRPDLIMESLAILAKEIEQSIEVEFVGDGNMLPAMKAKAGELGINASFSGLVNKRYISDALNKAHFLLHASNIETFCIVVAEALMTGTPVVASNVGGIPELVDESSGILCENTIEGWVKGLREAINKSFDYEQIVQNNINKFTYKTVGNQILENYHRVLQACD